MKKKSVNKNRFIDMGKKETRHGVGVRMEMKGLVVQFHLYQGFTPLGPGSST